MKKNDKNNNKKSMYIIVALLIVTIIGVSYAAGRRVLEGYSDNTIETGTVLMNYTEGSNEIVLENAMPMSDNEGKNQTGNDRVFDFIVSVTMNGNHNIGYEVTAEDITDSENKLDGSNVKINLMKSVNAPTYDTEVLDAERFGALDNEDEFGAGTSEMVLDSDSTTTDLTVYYRVKMWVASDYLIQNKDVARTFKIRINVYGKNIS